MSIEVRNLNKSFGAFQALTDVSLTVQTGELVALLGPSGSGKTTLLRIIAGLEFPTQGSILFNEEDVARRDARSLTRRIRPGRAAPPRMRAGRPPHESRCAG